MATWRLRFRSLLRREAVDCELDEELAFYLEERTRHHVDAGLSANEAGLAARRDLGSVAHVKDHVRDTRGLNVLDDLLRDTRYALRSFRRAPGFTAVAILSLALGIGANTAIFSLIDTLMLRLLPVRAPDQLVEFTTQYPGDPRMNGFAWKYYEQFRDRNHVFSDVVGLAPARFQASAEGFEPEAVDGAYVVGNFFSALGLTPAIGRLIDPRDDQSTAGSDPDVAVLSWSYWQARFHLDPAILGTHIRVNGVQATVIGVTPQAFFGLQVGSRVDVWVPVAIAPATLPPGQRENGLLGLELIARLKPGISLDQARAEMRVLDRPRIEEIASASRDSKWRQVKIDVEPAGAGFSALRDLYGQPLLVLMAVVGLLLLLACANIAAMLLARAAARQREMAVRIALGAGRRRLVRQMLTESLLLSLSGALVGILFAYGGTAALVRTIESAPPRFMSLHIQVEPDMRVLLFAVGVALLTGLFFGLAPALSASQSAPSAALLEGARVSESRSRRLFGKSLIVAQVAISVVLVSGASLFERHLSNLRNDDVGSAHDSVLLLTANPQGSGLDRTQLTALYKDLLGRLEAIPGVRSATVSGTVMTPGAGASSFVSVEGFHETSEARRVALHWVGPEYFATFGTPFVAGRDFSFDDDGRSRVAIVNRSMARDHFGGGSPVGKHLTLEGQEQPYEIVGVVGDAKYSDVHEAPPRQIYFNAFQDGQIQSEFALRTDGAPTSVAGDARRVAAEVLGTVRIAKETTLADQIDASVVPERLIAMLLGFFGGLGALLAAIGLYGLLAYTVARRTNEIGIRLALGATRRGVIAMVLRSALGLVGTGVVVGAPFVLWGRQFAAMALPNVRVDDAVPLALAVLAMAGVGLVAAFVPARRAARIDPMEALRHE